VNPKLLQVRNLRVEFSGRAAWHDFTGGVPRRAFTALHDVSFELLHGETIGLVGESGSGKSTLARSILRLIPAARGEVLWRGEDLLKCGAAALRRHRRDLQIVFQDPLGSLDPRMTVGEILAEPLRIFEPAMSAQARHAEVTAMLLRVGLAADMTLRYPHEFSGGQCQRIGIARAMMPRPALLICDEPVSSLDVSIQGQIVNLLLDLQRELGMAMLFISHNLALVRHISHRVLVMYLGRLVEIAPREALFGRPLHPYSRALLAAVPAAARGVAAFAAAPGDAPSGVPVADPPLPEQAPSGCAFRDRCPHAVPVCATMEPLLESAAPGHWVACHRWRELVTEER
jgi:oligopeptide transport system ATP-binding protein